LRQADLKRVGVLPQFEMKVIDDCALARAVMKRLEHVWMVLQRASQSLRSYETTLSQFANHIASTAFTQLRYSPIYWLHLVAMILTFVLPLALTFSANIRVWPFAWPVGA